jgi:hypothetical protein
MRHKRAAYGDAKTGNWDDLAMVYARLHERALATIPTTTMAITAVATMLTMTPAQYNNS